MIVTSELRLSSLIAPYGAVLRIQEIDLNRARQLVQRHGATIPRPPPYKADRICEALELPAELHHRMKKGESMLVCECNGFKPVLFFLVEFAADGEEEDDESETDPFE